ncbi:MAG TPA: GNAT family N-acetyltransferase, partial [Labilithrix sp.]|nr:GNAT family N-acetyltransferase [Labilithrix sp.]
MLSPVLIDDPVRLRAMAAEWAGLLERSSTNELSVHPDWMLPWWDVFGETGKRSLRSMAFYDGDRLVGLAPLLGRPHVYRPGIRFRRLEALASGEDEADESCSDYLGLIAERGSEGAVASAFASALTSGALGGWDELVLPSMNGESPLPVLLRDELARQGLLATLDEVSTSPYVALPKTWDAYLASLKQSKRGQLRKALRALEQWAGGEPEIERVRRPEQLARGREILRTLHVERWATEGIGEGVYASARYRAFQDAVMPRLLALGALDLGWMSVRGQPVAAFYNLRYDGRILHYQSGRKLDIPDDVRAGVTMHALLIKAAIADGMREYDFLAGASQYKMALANATRPLVTLRAARPSLVESARRAAEHATAQARRVRDYAKAAYAARRGGPAPGAA